MTTKFVLLPQDPGRADRRPGQGRRLRVRTRGRLRRQTQVPHGLQQLSLRQPRVLF